MSLRALAEQNLGAILEDGVTGFGWPITITDPDGNTAPLTGFSNDIAQLIDPDTGQAVSGRLASVALRISSLTSAGLGLPVGISDSALKPWLVAFDDINGNPYTFKVQSAPPDRGLGIVICMLEFYE
jgi:hypothetical protein